MSPAASRFANLDVLWMSLWASDLSLRIPIRLQRAGKLASIPLIRRGRGRQHYIALRFHRERRLGPSHASAIHFESAAGHAIVLRTRDRIHLAYEVDRSLTQISGSRDL